MWGNIHLKYFVRNTYISVIHTENVAGGAGQTESFQNVGGGKGVYNVLTFQKSGGARAHKSPPNNYSDQACHD